METLIDTLTQLTSKIATLNSSIVVLYSGSVLTEPPRLNFEAPVVQQEVITFKVTCTALGVRGQHGIYQLVNQVRQQLTGLRVTKFDPLVTAMVEVASQYKGETKAGYFEQDLIYQLTRPITNPIKNLC